MASKKKSQKSLEDWTDQDWRTRDRKPAKRKGKDGKTTTARYLPDDAWKSLTPAERKATDAKKRAASRKGKGVVANTKKAKKASKKARGK